MSVISEILSAVKHRPYGILSHEWSYYQEWNNALFLHWKVPVNELQQIVPGQFTIDTFDGNAYLSLVVFNMQKIRPRHIPAFRFISDFVEINIRTYINNDNKPGVYFLHIEAGKRISAFIARALSGLPYKTSQIKQTKKNYTSKNLSKGFELDVEFELAEQSYEKTLLDKWLTERYCLYMDKGDNIYRYDIHHKEWIIKGVEVKQLKLKYKIGEINLTDKPDLSHFSDGVKVLAWKRVRI